MLGKILSDRRRLIGMSIDQLVEKSGVPKGTVTKVLTGISPNPALETVKAIAYALGLTLDELSEDEVDLVSDKAMKLAMLYDSLDEVGKEFLDAGAAFAEKHFKKI